MAVSYEKFMTATATACRTRSRHKLVTDPLPKRLRSGRFNYETAAQRV
jgi:hypothetical protein